MCQLIKVSISGVSSYGLAGLPLDGSIAIITLLVYLIVSGISILLIAGITLRLIYWLLGRKWTWRD
jgi:hypothetical protein